MNKWIHIMHSEKRTKGHSLHVTAGASLPTMCSRYGGLYLWIIPHDCEIHAEHVYVYRTL